jgi:GcrA cell cycle regulator
MPTVIETTAWNDDLVRRLRALWQAGLSTAEIGRHLGMSKNAIVGKAHRLNLPARPSPIRTCPTADPAPPRPRQPVPPLTALTPLTPCAPAPTVPPPVDQPPSRPLTGVAPARRTGSRRCCWPIGDPGTQEFCFCDNDARAGKPYCDDHCRLAYRVRPDGAQAFTPVAPHRA